MSAAKLPALTLQCFEHLPMNVLRVLNLFIASVSLLMSVVPCLIYALQYLFDLTHSRVIDELGSNSDFDLNSSSRFLESNDLGDRF